MCAQNVVLRLNYYLVCDCRMNICRLIISPRFISTINPRVPRQYSKGRTYSGCPAPGGAYDLLHRIACDLPTVVDKIRHPAVKCTGCGAAQAHRHAWHQKEDFQQFGRILYLAGPMPSGLLRTVKDLVGTDWLPGFGNTDSTRLGNSALKNSCGGPWTQPKLKSAVVQRLSAQLLRGRPLARTIGIILRD